MIHARKDYNRFQEPKELMETIYALAAKLQSGTLADDNELAEIDKTIGDLNARYKVPSEGFTPIGEDEPVFLFRAQDVHFKGILNDYIKRLNADFALYGGDQESHDRMVSATDGQIARALAWERAHDVKTPDMPE